MRSLADKPRPRFRASSEGWNAVGHHMLRLCLLSHRGVLFVLWCFWAAQGAYLPLLVCPKRHLVRFSLKCRRHSCYGRTHMLQLVGGAEGERERRLFPRVVYSAVSTVKERCHAWVLRLTRPFRTDFFAFGLCPCPSSIVEGPL